MNIPLPLCSHNNALSAAEFYSYQLLWDGEYRTTTQVDRQFWEQKFEYLEPE